mmetsp:Transcript_27145/g.24018  ORF Transcript_27145/g.24018 Transcript_27145/m.24018 type:complete len:259 (+) Transcript_27145:28-804(+)
MSAHFEYFTNTREEQGFNLFGNYNIYENDFSGNNIQNDILYFGFENKNIDSKVENIKEIHNEFYSHFGSDTQSKTDKVDFNSSKNEEYCDVTSNVCENEYQEKAVEAEECHITNNSTVEGDNVSDKASKNYDNLFLMVENKDMYEIGSDDDELTPTNNKDLINLDNIISNTSTDLNVFIQDMLKSCPCDNLVKKQRIYKAKNIKRKRKTKSQIKTLEKELLKTPVWIKEDFKRLSESLSLNRDQVYKWYWDQRKKSDS